MFLYYKTGYTQRGIHLGSDLFHMPSISRDTSHGGRGSRSAPQARGESEVDDKLLTFVESLDELDYFQ